MDKLLDNLDLAVFAIVLAGVALVLGAGLGVGHDLRDQTLEDVQAAQSAVEDTLVARSYKDEPQSEVLAALVGVRDRVKATWLTAGEPSPLRAELFHHPAALADLREGRDLALRFDAPVDIVVDASPGTIRIAWSRAPKDTIEAHAYRIFRKVGDGEETKLVDVEEGLSYEDHAVEPGRRYSYRVQGITRDPAMLKAGSAETAKSKTASVRAARDFVIEARSYDADKKSARFLVKKLVGTVWHEKEFSADEGGVIGEVDAGSGVDYGTGTSFLRVETETKTVPEERDEVLFDAEGRVRLEAGEPISRRAVYDRIVETRRAVLRNELGEEESVVIAKP